MATISALFLAFLNCHAFCAEATVGRDRGSSTGRKFRYAARAMHGQVGQAEADIDGGGLIAF
jgi:hypothetical protein